MHHTLAYGPARLKLEGETTLDFVWRCGAMQDANPAVSTQLRTCANAGRRREAIFSDDGAKED